MELSKEDDMENPSKTLRISEEGKDIISLMPDSILAHILSFWPILDAIKTIQVWRFGNLWHTFCVFFILMNACCMSVEVILILNMTLTI